MNPEAHLILSAFYTVLFSRIRIIIIISIIFISVLLLVFTIFSQKFWHTQS